MHPLAQALNRGQLGLIALRQGVTQIFFQEGSISAYAPQRLFEIMGGGVGEGFEIFVGGYECLMALLQGVLALRQRLIGQIQRFRLMEGCGGMTKMPALRRATLTIYVRQT